MGAGSGGAVIALPKALSHNNASGPRQDNPGSFRVVDTHLGFRMSSWATRPSSRPAARPHSETNAQQFTGLPNGTANA